MDRPGAQAFTWAGTVPLWALAEAEAEKAARIGIGQAVAIEEQVRAYGGPQFQSTQQVMNRFAEAIQASQVDVVPKILIGGGGGAGGDGSSGSGSVIEALLTMLLSDRLGMSMTGANGSTEPAPRAEERPEVETWRKQMRERLLASTLTAPPAVETTAAPRPPAPPPVQAPPSGSGADEGPGELEPPTS